MIEKRKLIWRFGMLVAFLLVHGFLKVFELIDDLVLDKITGQAFFLAIFDNAVSYAFDSGKYFLFNAYGMIQNDLFGQFALYGIRFFVLCGMVYIALWIILSTVITEDHPLAYHFLFMGVAVVITILICIIFGNVDGLANPLLIPSNTSNATENTFHAVENSSEVWL